MRKRKIYKLKIKDVMHLAKHLGSTPKELHKICSALDGDSRRYYQQWKIKSKKGKVRELGKPKGRLLEISYRLKSLLQIVPLPNYVNGGVPGRSIRSNAEIHKKQDTLMAMDLENHFPNTSCGKVFSMFLSEQECSPEVAKILTRLTTLNGSLPQGSPTSTVVSNLVTLNLSKRLHGFTSHRGAKCSQYVDDYNISGSKKISRYEKPISNIIKQEGFKINISKTKIMQSFDEKIVTGIKINGNRLDVPTEKINEARMKIAALSNGKATEKEIRSTEGLIRYIDSFNHGTGKFLDRHFKRALGRP